MTTRVWFQQHVTANAATGETLTNSDVQFYLDTTFTNPLTFYDSAGVQGLKYHVGAYPSIPELSFDLPDRVIDIWAKSGDFVTLMTSVPALRALAQNTYDSVSAASVASANAAQSSASLAQSAATQVQQYIANGGGEGGLPAGTTLADIPDGGGRVAFTPGERIQLAGLPTSYLKVGTAATDAKAGNYKPAPADIGAVANLGGFAGIVGRTAAQGVPSASELALLPVGTYVAVDAS